MLGCSKEPFFDMVPLGTHNNNIYNNYVLNEK